MLVFTDIQKELENDHAAAGKHMLEVVNFSVALTPDLFRHKIVHTGNQHILVMRTIKDAHHTFRRCNFMNAPQKIVCQFFSRGNLKRNDIAPLWINMRKYMANGAILATGIHSLQHDEHTMMLRCRQQLL